MRKRTIVVGLLLAGVAIYLLRSFSLPPIAQWLNVSDPRFPVEYAIPLPGGNDTRPFAAAALVKAGLAERAGVLVNEATPDVADGIALPMHEVTRRVLQLRGVPTEDILMLNGTSTSTFSDIQIIGTLFAERPDATIAIVTSPSHTRRARWTVNRVLPDHRDQVCLIAALDDSYDVRIWWQDPGALHEILSEYLKLIFYWLAYSSWIQRAVVVGMMVSSIVVTRLVRRGQSQANPAPEAADFA